MRILHGQRGVAMVTVLLVAAGLTAVTSAATFVTIKEFGAGSDDRKASTSLAYAEAGLERFIAFLKRGNFTFAELNHVGCGSTPALSIPQGVIGNGTYDASMSVYDPAATGANRFAPAACNTRPTRAHPGQDGADNTYFVITSTGRHPSATRVVRQVVAMRPLRLPVGIFATFVSKQSAKHDFYNISMLVNATVTDRQNIYMHGNDSYYLMRDIFPDGVSGRSMTEPAPAAIHSAGTIYRKEGSDPQFGSATKNCSAEKQDNGGQSLWDSDGSSGSGPITSGCTGQTGYPLTSKFTGAMLSAIAQPKLTEADYQVIKDSAKNTGVYCSFNGSGTSDGLGTTCIKQGQVQTNLDYRSLIQQVLASGTNNVVAYFDFRTGQAAQNNVGLLGPVWGCDAVNPANTKSLVAVVRNGGVDFSGAGGDQINGAIIVDGDYKGNGNFTMNGSMIVGGTAYLHSSSQSFTLDSCWVNNMPGSFFGVTPGQWTEVDR
jgi:hypothetical protein